MLISAAFSTSAQAAQSQPYISIDAASGRILEHHAIFQRWHPASLTKLMTAYLAFSALKSGDFTESSPVQLSRTAVRIAHSRSGYPAGTKIDFSTALQLMLTRSNNDIAKAIAETLSKDEAHFVIEMNRTAQRLGLYGTHFVNSHGLSNTEHYSTARDIALLSLRLRQDFPEYMHYFTIGGVDMGGKHKIKRNTNNLLGRFAGADGLKTGFTCASGYNLSASATRNGRTIIAVVLGAPTIAQREVFVAHLLHKSFQEKGQKGLTIYNIRPYGENNDHLVDMRPYACSSEAKKLNAPYIYNEKKLFPSPHLGPAASSYTIIKPKPLFTPPKIVKK